MKITPIRDALDGEQVLAVEPPLERRVNAVWRRRLHLFTGRSLSHDALELEQRHRAGHLAVLGQTLSPGVVQGLEADLEDTPEGQVLYLAPGYGLTVQGEDVVVTRALRSPLADLRVRAPAVLLDTGQLPGPSSGRLAPRRLGATLGELLDLGLTLPRAAFLVLQPIVGERFGVFDPSDACERDPESEAFEDQQTVDGVRLLLELWPTEWLPLPEPGPRWRNRAAYAIFERERQSNGCALPWHELGLPVALVGRDAADAPYFIDRHAVVRAGGRPRARRPLVPGMAPSGGIGGESTAPSGGIGGESTGDRFLRRARLEQLAEHLTELRESAAELRAAEHFHFLPPAGILHREAVDWETFTSPFFALRFHLIASPLPLAELDAVLDESAGLSPLSIRPADLPQVEILVPVPEGLYDPRLLLEEEIEAEFGDTVARFVERRTELLQRHDDVLSKLDLLTRRIDGLKRKSLPDREPPTDELDPAEESYGIELLPLLDAPSGEELQVRAVWDLYSKFSADPVLGKEPLNLLLEEGDGKGLEGFIDQLEAKVKRADGKVDLGFARAQTDIYRFRQLVLGATAATRLTTSPALASIAQGTSAVATKRELDDFLEGLETSDDGAGGDGAAQFATGPVGGGGSAAASAAAALTFDRVADPIILAGDLSLQQTASSDLTLQSTTSFSADLATSVFQTPKVTVDDVVEQSPIVGQALRTVTVGERLREPPASESRNFTVANRFEVFRGVDELADMGLFVDDLPVPGVPFDDQGTTLGLDTDTGQPVRNTLTFSQVKPHAGLLPADPNPSQTDEGTFFNISVELLDHTVSLLRHLERRVHTYKLGLARARSTLSEVKKSQSRARSRLDAIDKELAEARHDVEVALSLADEEQDRLDKINARRRRILREEVRFLAYRRLRTVDLLAEAPARRLEPALAEDPVVACLTRPVEVPADLRTMVELFREAPVHWFRRLPVLLDQLDRPDVLRGTLVSARQRAERLTVTATTALTQATAQAAAPVPETLSVFPAFAPLTLAPSSTFSQAGAVSVTVQGTLQTALTKTLAANRQLVARNRVEVAQLDLSGLDSLSWLDARREAERHVALGDLLDTRHGRPKVVQQAASELDEIARLATCLYAGFGEVSASIRLDWAERLSQFDQPVDLADLSRLPRWKEIEFTDRRELQALVDGIYRRIDRRRKDALALAHDLVRVCLLLASHAPVTRLVSGQVEEPTTVRPNGRVKVRIEQLEQVRIGMPVMFFAAQKTAARGIVENMAGNVATARVVEAFQENVQLDQGARVELAETQAFERKGLGTAQLGARRTFSEVL